MSVRTRNTLLVGSAVALSAVCVATGLDREHVTGVVQPQVSPASDAKLLDSAASRQPPPVTEKASFRNGPALSAISNPSPRQAVERLGRVADSLNGAMGTVLVVRFGVTEWGAVRDGASFLTVDFSLFWELNEGALAALLATEMARTALGHSVASVPPGIVGVRLFNEQEKEACEYAGVTLGRLGYPATSLADLLDRPARGSGSGRSAKVRSYATEQRLESFGRGYRLAVEGRRVLKSNGHGGGVPTAETGHHAPAISGAEGS